jgi:hypothetical protein
MVVDSNTRQATKAIADNLTTEGWSVNLLNMPL